MRILEWAMNLRYVDIGEEYTERKRRLRSEDDESLEHVIERRRMATDRFKLGRNSKLGIQMI